ncbi:MAG TPA: phosphatase PAP2 family protein [Candidatus Saccharimonadales bacterium]
MNTNLFLSINDLAGKNPLLDSVMVFSADSLIYILFLAAFVCVAYLAYKRQWRQIMIVGIALAVSFVIRFILSKLFISDRPFVDHTITQLLPHAANQSFPSDHATAAFAIALAILALTRLKKTGWILLAIAAMIGFARIYTGVHYPLDVIGGLITAIAGVSITLGITKLLPTKQSVQFDAKSDT